MRQLVAAPSSLRALVGVVAALALGLAIGLGVTSVLASQPATTITACVSKLSGVVRIVPPGRACLRNETATSWQSGADLSGVEARLNALETKVSTLEAENAALAAQVPACLSTATDGTALFTGCNVQIVNGQGSTATKNGQGNLIVGYNEIDGNTRTGSHNVVVGPSHTYSNYGGLVVGANNTISGSYASVTGGYLNKASGSYASVTGGAMNTASWFASSISGGLQLTVSGDYQWVAGGSLLPQ